MFFTKISILILYMRILAHETMKVSAKVLLVIVVISHTWIVCNILTTCVPLEAMWNSNIRKERKVYCHTTAVNWSNYAILIGTDFLIFLLPLPSLYLLRLPIRQKIALCLVFLAAFG
jgi:hypothetical protein